MAVFNPVIGPAAHLAFPGIAQLGHRSTVRAQAIGGDFLRRTVALQRLLHEGEGGGLVALLGDEALEDLAFLVDCAPQLDHLPIQLHVHFVEVPAPVPEAAHLAYT